MKTTMELQLLSLLRKDLPASAFRRRPLQILWLIAMATAVFAATASLILLPLHWLLSLLIAVALGNLHASLFFFGHHLLHGSVVRSRWAQDLLMFPCTAIFGLSPHLWRVWHHDVHHPFTNTKDDPDHFGTLHPTASRVDRWRRLLLPGNNRWFRSILYLVSFFTFHTQGVLWMKSRRGCFRRLNRGRAILETGLIFSLWSILAYAAGPSSVFAILIPWGIANFLAVSVITTQHMLRPMHSNDLSLPTLQTAMSLSVPKFVDRIHFNVSHHVEHHLFPTVAFDVLPLVRESLRRHAPQHFIAPSYGVALLTVLLTPRIYDGTDLVDPDRGRRVSLSLVEQVLRGLQPLRALCSRVNHRSGRASQ